MVFQSIQMILFLWFSLVSAQCGSPPTPSTDSNILSYSCTPPSGDPTFCTPNCPSTWSMYGFPNITCQTSSSTWSEAGICCPHLAIPMGGSLSLSPTQPIVTYTCNQGYTLTGVSATVECINGNWNSTVSCDIINCPALPSPLRSCPNNVTVYGTTCPLLCANGYGLPQDLQQQNVTCRADATWDASSSLCTLCPANTYSTPLSNCANCPPNSTSVAGSAYCTCNAGFVGTGTICVANTSTGVLIATLKFIGLTVSDDVIRTELPNDVAQALNLLTSQIVVDSIAHPDSDTTYATIRITLLSSDNRTLSEIAAELQRQVQDPNSKFHDGTVTSHVDPHFFVYQIYEHLLFNFRRLSSLNILIILIVLLVVLLIFYCCNRKFFPSAHNTRLVALLLGLIAFGTNINFVGFVYVYFPEKMLEFYLSGIGIVVSIILNLFAVSYFLSRERFYNSQYSDWYSKHKLSTVIISFFSLANTKHTCLLNSEILSLSALSAPISSRCFIWLQFLAVITMFCCEVPCLISQIFIIQYLQSTDNDATIGIVFNSISLVFGILLCFVTGFLVTTPSPEGYDNDAPMRRKAKSIDPHFELELDDQQHNQQEGSPHSNNNNNNNDNDQPSSLQRQVSLPQTSSAIISISEQDQDQADINETNEELERHVEQQHQAEIDRIKKNNEEESRNYSEYSDQRKPTGPPPPPPEGDNGYDSD